MAVYFYNITPFDADLDYNLAFAYTGTNQSHSNRLLIKNSDTLSTVYDKTIETMQTKHLINATSLRNGVTYLAQIFVYDIDGTLCGTSDTKEFQCLSTPVFKFSNLTQNQTVKNSNFTAALSYSQAEGEQLQYYNCSLYNLSKTIISSSGTVYDTSNMNYAIYGLSDGSEYYIRAIGYTVSGISIDTGYVLFNVDYMTAQQWSLLTLENKPDVGAVKISSNVVTLTGYVDGTPVYVDDDFIDVRGGKEVVYNEDFIIQDNATVIGRVCDCNQNEIILKFDDGVYVVYKIGKFASVNGQEVAYLELHAPNPITDYVIYSNYIEVPNTNEVMTFCILRQNNLYEIRLRKDGGQ